MLKYYQGGLGMQIKLNIVDKAIKRKFIRPLNDGCKYNVNKLNNEQRVKHNETISLLTQANETLMNVDYNLKNYKLVDASTLLRSSFEYIMMAMMIQFDDRVYNEFITLGIERDKTRVCEIIDKFRTHMNEICSDMYQDLNRKEKLEMLTELYDKMCNFTHSTPIVSTMIEVKSSKEKEIFKLLMYQNYYFLKILLFHCLKYFTSDNSHYLELRSISFTYMFMLVEINNKIKRYNIDFSKYNDLLYYDRNVEYFEKNKKESKKINDELIELSEDIKNNEDIFIEELKMFLK